jgi:hypothetical protein
MWSAGARALSASRAKPNGHRFITARLTSPCKGGADSFRRGQQPFFHCEVRSPAPDYHGRIAELVRLSKVKVDLSLLTIESIPALL